jgi:hypothetical protein
MNRRLIFVLAALAFPLAAGAQQLRSVGPAAEPDMNVRMKGFRDRILLDTVGRWVSVPGRAVPVFRATLQVLDSLKIPVAYADSVTGVIHHNGFVARSRLGGKPVSSSLRCGVGLAGDYADSWRVAIAYAVFIKADGDHSSMMVSLVAGANDVEGVSKPAVQCGSTGGLELTIAKAVGLKTIQ